MKLYSGPLSLFSRKVEIALREKGIAFEREMVPFSQAEGYSPKHPDVLATNPKGQVPVLVDGDLRLFDNAFDQPIRHPSQRDRSAHRTPTGIPHSRALLRKCCRHPCGH